MKTILLIAIFVAILLVSDCHRIKRSDKHHVKDLKISRDVAAKDDVKNQLNIEKEPQITDLNTKVADKKTNVKEEKPKENMQIIEVVGEKPSSNKKITSEHNEKSMKEPSSHLNAKHEFVKHHVPKSSSALRSGHLKGIDPQLSFYPGKEEFNKKSFKPDLDIFIYGNAGPQQLYKSSSIFDPTGLAQFKGKDDGAVAVNQYDEFIHPRYKLLQFKSPIQRAIQFANMMVKVGLDDFDMDDYGSVAESPGIPFAMFSPNNGNKGSGHKGDRSLQMEKSYFCPLHAMQETILGNFDDIDSVGEIGSSSSTNAASNGEQMVCSCRLMKKTPM